MSAAGRSPTDADRLPCAFLSTCRDRRILAANRYLAARYGWEPERLVGQDVAVILSRASRLFCDSYVIPQAMAESVCAEVLLTLRGPSGERRPVVANVARREDGGFDWVFLEADNRDRLFEELEAARGTLEAQRARLEALARTDPLTGVLNRRAFDEAAERAFEEADRYGQPVSVLLMDIDHFKSINDAHGHEVGDRALTALGAALTSVCRQGDVVARFGGDEFACVLNHTPVDAALALCRRIHAGVAEASAEICRFTISIGVAGRIGTRPLSPAAVLAEADGALYDAKRRGRDTTAVRAPQPEALSRSA